MGWTIDTDDECYQQTAYCRILLTTNDGQWRNEGLMSTTNTCMTLKISKQKCANTKKNCLVLLTWQGAQ